MNSWLFQLAVSADSSSAASSRSESQLPPPSFSSSFTSSSCSWSSSSTPSSSSQCSFSSLFSSSAASASSSSASSFLPPPPLSPHWSLQKQSVIASSPSSSRSCDSAKPSERPKSQIQSILTDRSRKKSKSWPRQPLPCVKTSTPFNALEHEAWKEVFAVLRKDFVPPTRYFQSSISLRRKEAED